MAEPWDVQASDIGTLGEADSVQDENGALTVLLYSSDGDYVRFRVGDVEAARRLLDALTPLVDLVAEHDTERAAYGSAGPEERERVLRLPPRVYRGGWSVKS